MTRLEAARPYHTTVAVEPGPWRVFVNDDERDAGVPVEGWDYQTPLRVASGTDLDPDAIWEECDLPEDSSVRLVAMWECRATNQRGVGASAVVWDEPRLDLSFELPSSAIADRVVLWRQVVLDEVTHRPSPLTPHLPGSVLWNEPRKERTVLLLEGDAARFPTEIVDFTGTVEEGSAWRLEFRVDALDESPGNAIRLWVNAGHPRMRRFLDAQSEPSARELIAGALQWDVGRQLIIEAIGSDDFVDRWGVQSAETAGGSVELLIRRVLPGEDPRTLRALRARDIGKFEARLQSALGLWEETE